MSQDGAFISIDFYGAHISHLHIGCKVRTFIAICELCRGLRIISISMAVIVIKNFSIISGWYQRIFKDKRNID